MFDLSKINNQSYVQDFIYKNDSLDVTFFSEEDKEKIRQAYGKCLFVNPSVSFVIINQPIIETVLVEPEVPEVPEVPVVIVTPEVTPEVIVEPTIVEEIKEEPIKLPVKKSRK